MADKLSASELHNALKNESRAVQLHREALEVGATFGRYLETLDPSPEDSKLDAYGRQLKEAGIITRSNPEAGIWASEASKFFDNAAGRALYPEFFARQWRSVTFATPAQKRAILLSSDTAIGGWEKPYTDVGPFWNAQFEPAIPLSELVAMTTPISGEDYRGLYMTYDADQLHKFRVGESAEIPMATIASSERSIRLRKYGRGIRASYEQLRRTRVDKLAWWIRWVALQSEVDKVAAAIDVIVNGDGNANTAATEYNLLTLDAEATAGELSLKGWLSFRMKFAQPYAMTTALAQEAEALQLILLNTGSGNVPLMGNIAGIGTSLTPINTTGDGIRYGWTTDAIANKFIGIDKRFALEHVMEIGSEISETERFISNQTEILTMTENSAFKVLDASAAKILDISE